ncbi:hypothetical protein G6O67_000622 [Ophiocordyceps sinensis]|uniref:Uncharacterized protein n=1 Tax=Ophiocordyceps sinensis TaxID=72228 RepID=A0A8H4PZX5_9HYPO|nr:hypothetical protein G6O67_000622 [Ophiocordyceps sinensis]
MAASLAVYTSRAASATLAALAILCAISGWINWPSDAVCESRDISWSPVPRAARKWTWGFFPRATLFTESEFLAVKTPIEELEGRWKRYLPDHPIAIPARQLKTLHLPRSSYAHTPRSPDSILAIPEVFVQLECVNLLRQHYAHRKDEGYDYSPLAAFGGPHHVVLRRADLCIERLRDAIMCWGDLSAILQGLHIGEHGEPHSDVRLDAAHKCRDLDAVREWTEKNAVRAVRMDNAWWGGRVFE